ncbi:hypothetical protein [Lachnotalea glycerini]|uniref:IraD/Gp25-like domain-containing protein n=1 Tax=Lachnotalea glycerini TaxID=1763509 RepID=A0A371J1Z9_9FIRM|nr:hypothetical protein [Lachnotalea glycerini]RDY26745.1 hypothetical protein CG710_021470 [Lachnotalea glycerini]
MTIDTSSFDLNFNYQSPEIEDIKRCLVTLYSTKAGQQPLDREFGLACDFISAPIDVCKNLYALEVIEKTERYEKRAQVADVTYHTNYDTGQLEPIILLGAADHYKEVGEDEE